MATQGELDLRKRIEGRLGGALLSESAALYEKTVQRYEQHCSDFKVPAFPMDYFKAGDFLYARCKELTPPNTATWPAWQSQLLRGVVLLRGQPEPTAEIRGRLNDLHLSARQELGHESTAPPEAGSDKLVAMWAALRPDPDKNRLEWTIMVYSVFAYSFVLRPGELAEGKANRSKVTSRLKHLKFLPTSAERPHGGMTLVIPTDKSARRKKTIDYKTVYAPGCGGPMCPVGLMQQYWEVYNLDRAERQEEPIFAEMDATGTRLAARVITQSSVNRTLQVLCARANVDRHTSRATRAGRRNDRIGSGAPSPVVERVGRWASESAQQAYERTRQGGNLAHHLHPQIKFDTNSL